MDSDTTEVRALLPHRPPFLFVDRIVDRGAEELTAAWRVPEDLEVFRGHYPGNPVLPGVLIAEHAFQSAALLVAIREGGALADGDEGSTPVLVRIHDARYRRMVRPGEELHTTVTLEESLANTRRFQAAVCRGEARVARLLFTLALAREEAS